MLALAAGGAGAALLPGVLHAQSAPVVAQPVVQALPNPDTERLGDALGRLGRDQQDLNALIDAGNAARGLGDLEASKGFFARAERIAPDNGRVKAGLARTALLDEDPVSAIRYFREAEAAGVASESLAADQRLAYDLVGDTVRARDAYSRALARGEDPLLRQRLAISQAIAGELDTSEQTLMPLLRKQDKPAWRARAFTLAIAGQTREAIDLAETILPEPLAGSVAPYLRYMPRLTAAQQAAAANLGRFPRASEIGRDRAAVAAYAKRNLASADRALAPSGEALDVPGALAAANAATARPVVPDAKDTGEAGDSGAGEATTRVARVRTEVIGHSIRPGTRPGLRASVEESKRARERESEAVTERRTRKVVEEPVERIAPPEPKPGIVVAPGEAPALDANGELPPVSGGTAPARAGMATAALATPAPSARIASAPVSPATASPRASVVTSGTSAASAAPASAPAPVAPRPSLLDAFADLGSPPGTISRASGAVDISKIQPARPKPVEPPKPKKPEHPSRIWVQVGIGRDLKAIAYDWNRNARAMPEVFKGREPHVTDMNRTHRILVGPFATRKEANEYVGDLGKAGLDGAYPWISPAGQVVDTLELE